MNRVQYGFEITKLLGRHLKHGVQFALLDRQIEQQLERIDVFCTSQGISPLTDTQRQIIDVSDPLARNQKELLTSRSFCPPETLPVSNSKSPLVVRRWLELEQEINAQNRAEWKSSVKSLLGLTKE